MTDMETKYRGYRLIYYKRNDLWGPADHDLPIVTGTIAEVRKSIDRWEIDKQIAGGVKVWVIDHPDPAHWSKRNAVFRTGGTLADRTHMVRTRGFAGNPDSLYDLPRGDVAMDTPEVAEAIERAKAAYADLIAANDRWRKAKRAIPVMTAEEWSQLPVRDR